MQLLERPFDKLLIWKLLLMWKKLTDLIPGVWDHLILMCTDFIVLFIRGRMVGTRSAGRAIIQSASASCVSWTDSDATSVWCRDTNTITDHPEWGTSLMKRLSYITWYRSETWRPCAALIMHSNGANAFKAATLLQLTVDCSLHHLFSEAIFQGFPRWLSVLCKMETRLSPANLKLIPPSHRLGELFESLEIKYGILVSYLSDRSDKEKYMFPRDIFQDGGQNILASFYGTIYSTLTSATLLRVT